MFRGRNQEKSKWMVLFVLMFCYFFYYCGRQNFGFAILGIQQSFHLTTVDTGLISASMLFFYGLGQAINGSLGDKFSPRLLLTLGIVLSVSLNIITSFAVGFWTLMIPWCLNGYAQSLGFASGSKIIASWFEKKERGKAFGLYLSAAGMSSVIAFAISILVLNYFDWIWLFRIPVLFLLFSGIIFYVIARDKPEEMGYSPIKNESDNSHHKTSKARYFHVLNHFRFQMASISMGFCSIARYGLIFWVPVIYLGEDWRAHPQSAWITIALPIGMALGTIVSGSISDLFFKSSRVIPTILFMSLAAILTGVLYYTPTHHIILAMALLFLIGFFVFGPQASLFALCPDLLGTSCTATGVGVMNAYGYGFSALGEAFIGYLIHYTGQLSIVFVVVSGACVLSAITVLFVSFDKKVSSLKELEFSN